MRPSSLLNAVLFSLLLAAAPAAALESAEFSAALRQAEARLQSYPLAAAGAPACALLAADLGRRSFGDGGRFLLLAPQDRLLEREGLRAAMSQAIAPVCGWNRVAAVLLQPEALLAHDQRFAAPALRLPRLPLARPGEAGPLTGLTGMAGIFGPLALLLIVAGLLGAAAAARRARDRAQTEQDGSISLPTTLPPPPDSVLQRLREEREGLLAELRQTAADVARDTQRLQALRGAGA